MENRITLTIQVGLTQFSNESLHLTRRCPLPSNGPDFGIIYLTCLGATPLPRARLRLVPFLMFPTRLNVCLYPELSYRHPRNHRSQQHVPHVCSARWSSHLNSSGSFQPHLPSSPSIRGIRCERVHITCGAELRIRIRLPTHVARSG